MFWEKLKKRTNFFVVPIPLTVTFDASALKTGRAGPFLLPFECFAVVWTVTFVDSCAPSSTKLLPKQNDSSDYFSRLFQDLKQY